MQNFTLCVIWISLLKVSFLSRALYQPAHNFGYLYTNAKKAKEKELAEVEATTRKDEDNIKLRSAARVEDNETATRKE